MPAKTMSSATTFIFKYIFSSVWIIAFEYGAIFILPNKTPVGTNDYTVLPFLAAWIIGTLFILFTCAPLKRVILKGNELWISNYLKEVVVPINAISFVSENKLLNVRPITISFREKTAFGKTISFIPPAHFLLAPWKPHPVFLELRKLAGIIA